MTARLLAAVLFLAASSVSAQSADWTRVASGLDQLNAQILDWAQEYQRTAKPGPAGASAVAALHFKRGPVVASGLAALFDKWLAASETQKKTRYLAVARYFAAHSDDWGTVSAWQWYRCFDPPLDARYGALADEAGLRGVPEADAPTFEPEDEASLVESLAPAINAFLQSYRYPIVDTPLTRLGFDAQGVLVDGRTPRDRQLLNKTFTYAGTLVGLFGPGL